MLSRFTSKYNLTVIVVVVVDSVEKVVCAVREYKMISIQNMRLIKIR